MDSNEQLVYFHKILYFTFTYCPSFQERVQLSYSDTATRCENTLIKNVIIQSLLAYGATSSSRKMLMNRA